ncbi:MAG: PAS domain S-box protein [Desulfuromonadales bacterium]|nr:PAS domain S-box protein [Desulfuromonadales bacterium]
MDMDQVNFSSLIDVDELEDLFSDFVDMTGFAISLVDVVTHESVLKIGWRDVCDDFHLARPEPAGHCIENNPKIISVLNLIDGMRIDHCTNGFARGCSSIIIHGKHIANLFTGQVLLAPPDLKRFKAQARKLGYYEQPYLEELAKIPIVDEKRLLSFLSYLKKKITLLAQKNFDLLCARSENMQPQDLLQHISELAPMAIGISRDGKIQWTNRAMRKMLGYSADELEGLKCEAIYLNPEDFPVLREEIDAQLTKPQTALLEVQWQKKNGTPIDVYLGKALLNGNISTGESIFTALDITAQKKSQRLLKQSEERLSLALDVGNLGLWDTNIATGESFYSDGYFTMLGYQADEFPHTFDTWKKLLHPDDLEKTLNAISEVISDKKTENSMEFRMLSATGEYRWILGYGKVVEHSSDGIPLRIIGIHEDITPRKHYEQDLLSKAREYQELIDNIGSGVAICRAAENGNGFIVDNINAAGLKITQHTLGEVIGKQIAEIFPGLEPIGILDVIKRVYETGTPEFCPTSNYQDENLDLWTTHYVYKLSSGKVVVVFNDITEIKQAQDALQGQLLEFEQIIDLAADAFFLGDPQEAIISVNQQATVLTGFSRNELLGRKLNSLFSEAENEKAPLNFALLKSGGILMKERELTSKSGVAIPIEMHSKMMPDGKFQSFFRDITERKQSQVALFKSQYELERKRSQLEETNIALKILIKQAEQEKLEVEENVAANVLSLVEPHLKKLKLSGVKKSQANLIEIVESILENLVSPFVRTSIAMNLKLSPAELHVANLIKQGKTSKQIADLLGLSYLTVDKHRSHIRKKIGVTNKDISLRELLTSRS